MNTRTEKSKVVSKAYDNLSNRLKDIDQLMQAHTALTQFQRARKAAEKAGGELTKISEVVDKLVSPPRRGRRHEVGALNRAAIILLCAHLEGYIEDIFSETAMILLKDRKEEDINWHIEQSLSSFSNPHADRIDRLFASIGLLRITNKLSWQKASNRSIKNRLTSYITLRNKLAHGEQERVDKATVIRFMNFVKVFAKKFDELINNKIEQFIHHKS